MAPLDVDGNFMNYVGLLRGESLGFWLLHITHHTTVVVRHIHLGSLLLVRLGNLSPMVSYTEAAVKSMSFKGAVL